MAEPSKTSASSRRKSDATLVSDRVADRLMARIASGEWMPGQRLPGERQLAEMMGVSRVSVRAALQTLKARGFVDAVQGGGTRVVADGRRTDPGLTELVRVNPENLADLAEIRCILEVWAVRRAAQNAADDHIAELADIIAASEADIGNGKHRTENDIRFHLAIAKASGSAVYMHLMAQIRGILSEMVDHHRYEIFPSAEDDQTILAHHRAIFEGIRGRDPHGAERAMQTHLGWVVARYQAEKLSRRSPLPA